MCTPMYGCLCSQRGRLGAGNNEAKLPGFTAFHVSFMEGLFSSKFCSSNDIFSCNLLDWHFLVLELQSSELLAQCTLGLNQIPFRHPRHILIPNQKAAAKPSDPLHKIIVIMAMPVQTISIDSFFVATQVPYGLRGGCIEVYGSGTSSAKNIFGQSRDELGQ